ncbi:MULTISPECIES: head maturation protease, ClpP-related [Staphylococcus]|uniref:ATP-dependent Clp protease proteolytic subunit n=2 Tax=Staphylococcus TaxID=1279 RepID=A0ABY1GXG6_9STAP|nr:MULTISPECIES: head maturation protease, ClpP-related [Staphylococcus]ATH63184.1 serine protease [Staphylococcus pasteuri]MCF7600867.1 Clp protease ClpP [Staphylococcus pasteuri]MDO6572992.1 Clp protease ClpP [Staphylococcus pasteuri_A]MEB6208143.1 Clp protease ClpP [Staphylococcus pasteuri]UXR66966.1 Clp protease ClpP [Staphylococcus pasteuri]
MANNEIDIYGLIDSATIEGMTISPQYVRDQLKAMGDVDEVIVNINSNGGDVFSGVTIYNMLKRFDAHITVNVDGLAASIASVIAMAGDTINMPGNAMLMVHNAWTIGEGDSRSFKKQAEDLERINSVVFNSYVDKNPDIDHAILQDYMDEETWLTAKEAKKLGLIDNITENSRVAAATTSTILGGDKFMARYHNEDPNQQPKETNDITVEDVMDKLEEILAEVKKGNDKGSDEPNKQTESKPAENSFARLFNMNIK